MALSAEGAALSSRGRKAVDSKTSVFGAPTVRHFLYGKSMPALRASGLRSATYHGLTAVAT